ncbi:MULTISPECIES: DUF6069 family protein [Catenuloplanes]|uniref:Uncharacterized protein n=1 Tax=Catenuloplanes niger TaxID=587534 RepID=A0AAE3ZTR0_9ACTN|nr:DUF6069 family protein [Catenuloplanes niger]MDR7325702.1 hypothetical protein [Catenuloplanes niger]
MRTLTLRGGARVPVTAAEWSDAFGVVVRGRVRLELRDGTPGPVLGRDAGFWLRGTGVRALHNPGRRTAHLRIHSHRPSSRRNDMISTDDTRTRAGRSPGLAVTGLVATVAAVAATTVAAALARTAGVDFAVSGTGETIPLSGFAVVTGFFSLVGVAVAAAFRRWSDRPAHRFVRTTTLLTALSLVPPLLTGAAPATVAALVVLHLIPAAVLIPALARHLRRSSPTTAGTRTRAPAV